MLFCACTIFAVFDLLLLRFFELLLTVYLARP